MYTLGAIQNSKDLRDIDIAQVQAPVKIPEKYETDILWIPVFNQLANGSCVGHAHAVIHIYNEFKENKKLVPVSPRYLYALSKKYDNYTGQGTSPRVTAKIQVDKGCASETYVPNDNTLAHDIYIKVDESTGIDAGRYKMKGYAFVADNLDSLKQAIYQNGLVAITISVGNYDTEIKKGTLGLHRVVAYGYDGDKILFRNSWGKEWGNNGNGFFYYKDQSLLDSMTFVDMPNEIKEEAKKKYKYFSEKEIVGLKPEFVEKLDKARGLAGFPFVIVSGFRTPEHNKKVGGKDNSAHLRGYACDIKAETSEKRWKLIKACMDVGFTRFGVNKTTVHVDCDPVLPQNVIWHYYE